MHSTTLTPMIRKHYVERGFGELSGYMMRTIIERNVQHELASDRYASRRKRERRCPTCTVFVSALRSTCDFCD
jgi:hypothetical protein